MQYSWSVTWKTHFQELLKKKILDPKGEPLEVIFSEKSVNIGNSGKFARIIFTAKYTTLSLILNFNIKTIAQLIKACQVLGLGKNGWMVLTLQLPPNQIFKILCPVIFSHPKELKLCESSKKIYFGLFSPFEKNEIRITFSNFLFIVQRF